MDEKKGKRLLKSKLMEPNLIIMNLIKRMITESSQEPYDNLETRLNQEIAHRRKTVQLRLWSDVASANFYTTECLNEFAVSIELIITERKRLRKIQNMNNIEFKQMMKLGKLLNKIMVYQEDFAHMNLEVVQKKENA